MMGRLKSMFQFLGLYVSGLWLLFRRINRKRLLILMYHGVVPEDVGLWTQVTAEEFECQMAYLKKAYNVVSLDDAIAMLRSGAILPDYTAVVTFDDGFMNNKTQAYPILKKHNLPATVFLSTSLVDDTNEYDGLLWPDYITCLIRSSKQTKLDLSDLGLKNYVLGDKGLCTEAIYDICENLKQFKNADKLRMIKIIAERAEVSKLNAESDLYRGLRWDDVKALDAEGLMTFGAHTITHPILSRIPDDEVEKEITESKRIIEEKLGRKVTTFAYPNGKQCDYNDFAKTIASQHFICALTTTEGLVARGDDLYGLCRVGLGNNTSLWEFKLLVSRAISVYYRLLGK